MTTLILFSTRDGQTRDIAASIINELSAQGVTSEMIDLHNAEHIDWARYDSVAIGASIRYGHFHPSLMRFVTQHAAALNTLPGAFFSVNLVARKADKRTPETNSYTRKFLEAAPWKPQLAAVFAGALRYPRYKWYDRMMIRLIMKMTGGETDTSKEVVYTDWEQVKGFARNIARLANNSSVI